MKLISMTDFVLEQTKLASESKCGIYEYIVKIRDYANLLKQPLELWMFVPCDEDGNVLELPTKENSLNTIDHESKMMDYQQAKEACIFEGFEWNVAEFCDEPMIELEDKKGNYFCYDCEDKNFSKDEDFFCSDIEDLLQFNLQLTQTAIKKLGL